jgi:NADH-quinone oxidoreductase subunit N
MLGLCTVSLLGWFAAIYYFFIYILTSVQIFSILVAVRRYPGFWKLKNLVEFVSLLHANPVLSFLLVLGLLSLAGIPPFVGFYGKILIFLSLISTNNYLLALIAVLFSVLTCIYYIRLIRFIWFVDHGIAPVYFLVPLTDRQALFISFISIFNIFLFFFQGPLLLFFHDLTVIFLSTVYLW